MQQQRRSTLKKILATIAGFTGITTAARAMDNSSTSMEKETGGTHFKGDITSHTDHVLKDLEDRLKKAGSSMEKVLKVNVYLNDIADYKGMNEVYKGRFGKNPPVRTTVAVAKGGVPGDSLVEIDCIAMAD